MLLLAIILLLASLAIAACGAYFSIIGLSLLFVGAGVPIMIMGTTLEVGKLVAVTFLHQYWEKINLMLKIYLSIACLALMTITSLGIYGYLASGYNTTSIKVKDLQQQVDNNNRQIETFKNDIIVLSVVPNNEKDVTLVNINKDKQVEQLNMLVKQKEQRINEIKLTIEGDKKKAMESIALNRAQLDISINKVSEQIKLYNDRLAILDKEVQTWIEKGDDGSFFKKSGLDKARIVKEQQEKERADIDSQIKSVQDRVDKLRIISERQIDEINSGLLVSNKVNDAQIIHLQEDITKDKQDFERIQSTADVRISNLLSLKETKIKANELKTKDDISEIEKLQSANNVLQSKILTTDVGTFKYVAKTLNLQLDQTVTWFIWLIMSVFDPLAVSLLLCFNIIIKNYRLNKAAKKEKEVKPFIPIIIEPKPAPVPVVAPVAPVEPVTSTAQASSISMDELALLKHIIDERKAEEKRITERKAKGKQI